MTEIRRLEHHRYVGVRDTMRVYDTTDDAEAAELRCLAEEAGIIERTLVQTFAPDSLAEARNRGFRP